MPAYGLQEEREENRRTLTERCERAADLINSEGGAAVAWCHLNDESTAPRPTHRRSGRADRIGVARREGRGATRLLPRRRESPRHQACHRRMGPELAARPPHDLLSLPLLRAVLPGRPSHVAIRTALRGGGRRRDHRGRSERPSQPSAQVRGRRPHVRPTHRTHERRTQGAAPQRLPRHD